MTADDAGSLLTAQQVARKLALSLRSVRRLIDAGNLRVVRIARSVRIRPEDLADFVNKHTVNKPLESADS